MDFEDDEFDNVLDDDSDGECDVISLADEVEDEIETLNDEGRLFGLRRNVKAKFDPNAQNHLKDFTREEIVSHVYELANIIGSITGYPAKTLMIEVSKVTREQLANNTIKPDYGLFRVEMFKYLLKYSEDAEKKNKILASMLIDLCKNELKHVDFKYIKMQDLLSKQIKKEKISLEGDGSPEAERVVQCDEGVCVTARMSRVRHVSAALVALLNLFAKFNSPKTVYREAELREIYREMLLSSDLNLQSAALQCLLSYKENFMMPYAENLNNLLVEKKLNDELVRFTVDEQNCVVADEHRVQLMPIVMRILYGRFNSHSTVRDRFKRVAIFRFFAGCKPAELGIFIQLMFSSFLETFKINPNNFNVETVLASVTDTYDPSATVPLYQLRGVLTMVNNIFVRLSASLSGAQMGLSFTISMICASLVNCGLYMADKLDGATLNMLKSLRILVFRTFIQFFRSFRNRYLPEDHVYCLFNKVLEPMIIDYNDRLPTSNNETAKRADDTDGFIVQASVAKFLCYFTEHYRYFCLLNIRFPGKLRRESPASLLCNTLLYAGTTKPLQNGIVKAILNLLKFDDDDVEAEELSDNLLFNALPQHELLEKEGASYATRILLPHLRKILEYLSSKIPQNVDTAKVPAFYLDILSRISVFVEDDRMGETFALTFLSYLGSKRTARNKDRIVGIIHTLAALSRHISDPSYALRRITRLLSKLSDRSTRGALMAFIDALKANQNFPADALIHLDVLIDLESYDRSRIDEPDLERRYKAFERLEELYSDDARISIDIVQIFLHSHAFCIIHSSDIALRKTTSIALRQLINYISTRFSDVDASNTLRLHLIPLVLSGLNSEQELCRIEFVNCLADLVARFPNHPHFAALQPLNKYWSYFDETANDEEMMDEKKIDEHEIASDEEIIVENVDNSDGELEERGRKRVVGKAVKLEEENSKDLPDNEAVELNFFANAVHIQVHRRQRAFYRLTEQLNSGELEIPSNVLLNYILPLFRLYLLETDSKLSAISDQSLKLFSVILLKTPWRTYKRLLESYVREIEDVEKTKGTIRVIITILSAFHFDLHDATLPPDLNITPKVADQKDEKKEESSMKEEKKSRKSSTKALLKALGFDEEDEDENEKEEEEKVEKDAEDDVEGEEEDGDLDNDESELKTSVQPFMDDVSKSKVIEVIVRRILPRLRQALQTTTQKYHHRKNQGGNNYAVEDELLVRAPLALAIAKLLRHLPDSVLDEYLNGIVASLNRLLMSRSATIRQGSRRIMEQVIQVLGSKHLPFIIKELKEIFVKGFQIHVMIFTVHSLIASLEGDLKTGDLDVCFVDIFEICKLELFGDSSLDERKVGGGVVHVPEAKGNKSGDTFVYLGRFLSANAMSQVLKVIRDTIDDQPKGRVMKRLSELLRCFSNGLHRNVGIDIHILLDYVNDILGRNMSEMLSQQQQQGSSAQQRSFIMGGKPPSCLLLPPEPKRIGELVKTSMKSKVSIFVEFALQLLADVLKIRAVCGIPVRTQSEDGESGVETELNDSDKKLICSLNAFVPLVIDGLRIKFVKIVALSLRCLSILLRWHLTKINKEIQTIMDRLFVILMEYSGMGLAGNKPVIIELNQLLFKCLTMMIRGFPILVISPRRVEILLNYVETDVLDSHRQATSFSLIKAIIGRKIDDEKVEDVIQYLSELSITTVNAHTRTQCRQTVLLYISTHPAGKKKLESWIEFFANQTEYQFEAGRRSALEMLYALVDASVSDTSMRDQLNKSSLFLFAKLASRLVNDECEECQKYVMLTLRKLLASVNESSYNDAYAVSKDWLQAESNSVRLLALKAFRVFAEAHYLEDVTNSGNVATKLYEITAMLFDDFSGLETPFGRYSEAIVTAAFEYLNSYLDGFPAKFLNVLGASANCDEQMCHFSGVINNCLTYSDSATLQSASSAFVGRLLAALCQFTEAEDAENVNATFREISKKRRQSIAVTPRKVVIFTIKRFGESFPAGLKGVCLSLCRQIAGVDQCTVGIAEQAVKNILVVFAFLNSDDYRTVCIRLAGLCYHELTKDRGSILKRQQVFKLVAAAVLALKNVKHTDSMDGNASEDALKLRTLCAKFLPLIYREMSRKSDRGQEELYQLATEVAQVFRSRLGKKRYSTLLIKCQRQASTKYEERRRNTKTLAVRNPAAAAEEKQRAHERKRIAKRRRLDAAKPHRLVKRRRAAEFAAVNTSE